MLQYIPFCILMKKRLFLKINIELFFFNVSKRKYFPWQKKEKINSKTKVKFNGWHIWLFQIQKNCPDLETFNWNFSSVLVGIHRFDDNKCFLFQMKANFFDPWSTIVKHSFSDYGTLISFPGEKKRLQFKKQKLSLQITSSLLDS